MAPGTPAGTVIKGEDFDGIEVSGGGFAVGIDEVAAEGLGDTGGALVEIGFGDIAGAGEEVGVGELDVDEMAVVVGRVDVGTILVVARQGKFGAGAEAAIADADGNEDFDFVRPERGIVGKGGGIDGALGGSELGPGGIGGVDKVAIGEFERVSGVVAAIDANGLAVERNGMEVLAFAERFSAGEFDGVVERDLIGETFGVVGDVGGSEGFRRSDRHILGK